MRDCSNRGDCKIAFQILSIGQDNPLYAAIALESKRAGIGAHTNAARFEISREELAGGIADDVSPRRFAAAQQIDRQAHLHERSGHFSAQETRADNGDATTSLGMRPAFVPRFV